MKVRNGWVGNSSSSSFIILMGEPLDKDEFKTWFGDCGHRSEKEESKLKLNMKIADNIKQLYESNEIGKDELNYFINSLDNDIPDACIYVNTDGGDNIDIIKSTYYDDFNLEKVVDLLWNAFKNKKNAIIENNTIKNDNKRTFYKIIDWKEQLENKNSYLYNVLREDVKSGLDDKLDYKPNTRDADSNKNDYNDVIYAWDNGFIENSKSLIEFLTQSKIQFIKTLLDEYEGELDCYCITFCTDDGNSNEFDSVGRQGCIFRDTIFHVRDENS